MQLARHSDPKLTIRTYGRLGLADLGGAVGRLPAITPGAAGGSDAAALPATGTDGRHVPKHVPVADSGRVRSRTREKTGDAGPSPPIAENTGNEGERGPE